MKHLRNRRSNYLIICLAVTMTLLWSITAVAQSNVSFTRLGNSEGGGSFFVHSDGRFLYNAGPNVTMPDYVPNISLHTVDDAGQATLINRVSLLASTHIAQMDSTHHSLYIAANNPEHDLVIVDTANAYTAAVIGTLDIADFNPQRIEAIGDYVVMSDGFVLAIVDVRDRANPAVVSHDLAAQNLSLGGGIRDIEIAGDHLYVAAWRSGVIVFDMSNPARPTRAATIPAWGAERVIAEANTLYIDGVNDDGLVVADISNPAAPTILSRIGGNWHLRAVHNGFALITGYHLDPAGVIAIDVRDRANPQFDVAQYYRRLTAVGGDSRFVYIGYAGAIEVLRLQEIAIAPPVADNLCPESGRWPPGCTPRTPDSTVSPPSSSSRPPGQPCPTSGKWPAGCVPAPHPVPLPGAGQRCPTSGRWPQGCIP